MTKPVIGGLNESSLHRQLKELYCTGGAAAEQKTDGYIVDVLLPGGEIVEIQTANFAGMRKKLAALLPEHPVRLVHPVAAETFIRLLDKDGNLKSERRSPKRGTVHNAAAELVYLAELLPHPNLTVEIVLTRQQEIRRDDGNGSWRRRGVSIEERRLIDTVGSFEFRDSSDYMRLLPPELPSPFSNPDIAEKLTGTNKRGKNRLAGAISRLLRRLGLIEITGKDGNRLLYTLTG